MLDNNRKVILLITLLISSLLLQAQDARYFKQLGLQLLADRQYEEALTALLSYQKEAQNDKKILLEIAICTYHINQIEESERYLNTYLQAGNKETSSYSLYHARLQRAKGNYQLAAIKYKDYLRMMPESLSKKKEAKQELLQCGVALRNANHNSLLGVENCGEFVNSSFGDICPIASPNYESTFYFSSNRRGNMDIYIMEEDSLSASILDRATNTGAEEQLLGFGCDGQAMYFLQNKNEILIDSFVNIHLNTLSFNTIVHAEVRFFCDSILLFASDELEGFGGYDLYYCKYLNGNWSSPQNLGANINSAFDERAPFLDKDGRTLYFSSNHPRKSIGGFDIFKSIFDLGKELWSSPQNLGATVNTYADELDFFLNAKGSRAYFSSNHWKGYGEEDIYQINTNGFIKRAYPLLLFDDVRAFKQMKLAKNFDLKGQLFFRIQLASQTHFQEDFIPTYLPVPHIEFDSTQQLYHYYVGTYQSFETANEWYKEIRSKGWEEANVVAFLEQKKMEEGQVKTLKEQYSDLLLYWEYLKASSEEK